MKPSSHLDPRVVPPGVAALLRACQAAEPSHLGGGAALGGAYLGHRLSADVDLFFHDRAALRRMVEKLPALSEGLGFPAVITRDDRDIVGVRFDLPDGTLNADLVFDSIPDVEPPPPPIDGVTLDSLADLRANKVTCILSRNEVRDLVDLMFLDRAGYPPENDLGAASRKDAGIDPATLAWLLGQFRVAPLPTMLVPLTSDELRAFRDELRERFRRLALPA